MALESELPPTPQFPAGAGAGAQDRAVTHGKAEVAVPGTSIAVPQTCVAACAVPDPATVAAATSRKAEADRRQMRLLRACMEASLGPAPATLLVQNRATVPPGADSHKGL
jgi:hypothetical protein